MGMSAASIKISFHFLGSEITELVPVENFNLSQFYVELESSLNIERTIFSLENDFTIFQNV